MIGKLLFSFSILGCISLHGDAAGSQDWPRPVDEAADEKNDALIFRAVVESMRQWTLLKQLHHRTKREVSKVCYEDVGCFEDTGPFSYLEMLPSPPKEVGTRFLVYGSRKARSIPMEVPADDINDSAHRAIDPDLPTKVIVHGFGSSCDHVWVYEMRSALMTVHECNIVCVDWGPGSAVPNYVRAAANTRLVGRQLAKLIRSLNVPLEKVHLIGFSLGAHVAGFAGAELGNVSRITGLDPAGPLFESHDPRARLDQTDAFFVDVIHSNGEQLLLGGLGSWQPMGDVDFYPNGGRMQTGCSNLFLGAVSDIIWSSAVEGRSLCNHRRAYKLFTDSVSPKCRFPAFPCENGYDGLLRGDCFPCGTAGAGRPCGDMGYYSDQSPARGQLYLLTREEEPFCAHQYQLKVYNSHNERSTKSYGKLQVTLVGDGSFNETFAMTRKDEKLLVGSVLQTIVVPHPAISSVDSIEVKYTAYSGWISSGSVSWSIDKVAIVDSFGKILSVCRKGLILESGKPVHLPLFPGECNVPEDPENSTSPVLGRLLQDKPGGIGPFTKEHNYDTTDTFPVETFSNDRSPTSSTSKGVGPFTKEQNLRIIEGTENAKSSSFEESGNRRSTNPWNILDISTDGDSNSLENNQFFSDSERGRGFLGSNIFAKSVRTDSRTEVSTEFVPEIREPVLQLDKKETARSLKLPEITEPLLRPRAARQNARPEISTTESQKDEIQETSSTSRGFTVQFLPERLAGILAQAERYARQTLLPLISQYTPSFVTGARTEEPTYFPPLGEIVTQQDIATEQARLTTTTGKKKLEESSEIASTLKQATKTESTNLPDTTSREITTVVETTDPEKPGTNSTKAVAESTEWIPIPLSTQSGTTNVVTSRQELNVSKSLNWDQEKYNWTMLTNSASDDLKTEVDDWIPITAKTVVQTHETTSNVSEKVTSAQTSIETVQAETKVVTSSKNTFEEAAVSKTTSDRKYIPLTDPTTVKELPTTVGELPTTIRELPTTIRELPSTIKELPSTIKELPSTIKELPSTIKELPSTIKELPSTIKELPSTIKELPSTIKELPSTIKELPSTIKELPSTIKELPSTIKELPTTIIELPTTIKELPTTTKELPTTTKELPSTIKELPSTIKELPTTIKEVPTTIKEVPTTIKELSTTIKELPSTSSNDVSETLTIFATQTHIQKIPKFTEMMGSGSGSSSSSTSSSSSSSRSSSSTNMRGFRRNIRFPYAYEKRKDPRTRYIPLIPEDDIGRIRSSAEKDV